MQAEFRTARDEDYRGPLRSSTTTFVVGILLTSLGPILAGVACHLCMTCVRHHRTLACCHRNDRTRRDTIVQSKRAVSLVGLGSTGVAHIAWFRAALICSGWSVLALSLTPGMIYHGEIMMGGHVRDGQAALLFKQRVGWVEYYSVLLPWGGLLLVLSLSPIDTRLITFVSALLFALSLLTSAVFLSIAAEQWTRHGYKNETFTCSNGSPGQSSPKVWPFTIGLFVNSGVAFACAILLVRVLYAPDGVSSHALSHAEPHVAAMPNMWRAPRVRLRRVWLVVRLLLLVHFLQLLASLLANLCRYGRMTFFWMSPAGGDSASMIEFFSESEKTARIRAFPEQDHLGGSLWFAHVHFPGWVTYRDGIWRPLADYRLATNHAFAQALSCFSALVAIAVSGRTNRGRALRFLHRLLQSRTGAQRAVAFAAFFSGSNGVEVCTRAARRFCAIEVSTLTKDVFTKQLDNQARNATVRKAELTEVDAFVSHAHADDAISKVQAIQAWARDHRDTTGDARLEARIGRGERIQMVETAQLPVSKTLVWLDVACLDQQDVGLDLQCLPVYIFGCKHMLALAGPTFPSRLWVCQSCKSAPSTITPSCTAWATAYHVP